MPVNLTAPRRQDLLPIRGCRIGTAEAQIKKPGRKDLTLIELQAGSRVAASFTQNRFCAAPVTVAREHLQTSKGIRALLINTGNANAGTGEDGIRNARASCAAAAGHINVAPRDVLPFSTGVIMEPLPLAKIASALPQCVAALDDSGWHDAAHAIMTTDIVAKGLSKQFFIDGATVTITGIAKGSGMIHPNMATMLCFIATDAAITQPLLDSMLKRAVAQSFNAITVDGDTSTNDACVLIATGQSGAAEISDGTSSAAQTLQQAVNDVTRLLAQAIVRDGEGATKFIAIRVAEGREQAECRQVAYAIAHSPLVKTAFFASDPNLGRLLAAIGYAGIGDLDVSRVRLYLGDLLVAEHGGRSAAYDEGRAQTYMRGAELDVNVMLGRGDAEAVVWTCDFSYDYVRINAEYRS